MTIPTQAITILTTALIVIVEMMKIFPNDAGNPVCPNDRELVKTNKKLVRNSTAATPNKINPTNLFILKYHLF